MAICILGDIHFRDDKPYFVETCEKFLDWYNNDSFNSKDNDLILLGDLVERPTLSGRVAEFLERFYNYTKFRSIHIVVGNHDLKRHFGVEQLAYDRLYGFQYSAVYDKVFNIVPYIFRSFILFLTFVVANWAMCTLFDGEGSMKNIFIDTAYALIPYVASGLIATVLSHIFVDDEYIFISAIEIIGAAWTVVLFLSGMKAVHQFSFGKTLALLLLTLVAMIAILFLLILLLTLFQQVLIFIFSIYTELSYRLRV